MDDSKKQQVENYAFVQILIPYDQRYGSDVENQQRQINAALNKFVKKQTFFVSNYQRATGVSSGNRSIWIDNQSYHTTCVTHRI